MTASGSAAVAGGSRRRACILSLSAVSDEPRVRRQCLTLVENGWSVTVVGFPGRSLMPDGCELVPLDREAVTFYSLSARHLLTSWSCRVALEHFWRQGGSQHVYDRMRQIECDMVLAHDYFTAPIAERLSVEKDVPFAVDCHEYARAQYSLAGSWRRRVRWFALDRPYIDSLQSHCLGRAAVVTTVCDGIADLLYRDYRLPQRPSVVRGTPSYQSMPFRATGRAVKVLYHGLLVPTRGLEQAIASVKLWRPEFSFVIRGVGHPKYIESLRRLAVENCVSDRITFEPPLPLTELIGAANLCDIGYVVLEQFSAQRTFTLPNKFFEYIMAGMALCVSDLPELARLVRQFDLGELVPSTEPAEIAKSINAFTPDRIDSYKRRSMAAARELCWERESARMTAAFERAVPGFARAAATDVRREAVGAPMAP